MLGQAGQENATQNGESQGSKNEDRGKARSRTFGSKGHRKTVGVQSGIRIPWLNEALDRVTWSGACGFCLLSMSSVQAGFRSSVLRMDTQGLSFLPNWTSAGVLPGAPRDCEYSRLATGIWASVHCSHFEELDRGLAIRSPECTLSLSLLNVLGITGVALGLG